MTWWIDEHEKGVPNWAGWCRNERSIRGHDSWSWTIFFHQAHASLYDTLESDSKKPFYLGCKKSLTWLLAVLSLVNVKVRYRWSDKSFTSLLKAVEGMLPEENMLPKRYYGAKKTLCLMGMEYQKIHACPNDCIQYKDEFEEMHKYPKGGVSRYKVKDGNG